MSELLKQLWDSAEGYLFKHMAASITPEALNKKHSLFFNPCSLFT